MTTEGARIRWPVQSTSQILQRLFFMSRQKHQQQQQQQQLRWAMCPPPSALRENDELAGSHEAIARGSQHTATHRSCWYVNTTSRRQRCTSLVRILHPLNNILQVMRSRFFLYHGYIYRMVWGHVMYHPSRPDIPRSGVYLLCPRKLSIGGGIHCDLRCSSGSTMVASPGLEPLLPQHHAVEPRLHHP